MWINFACVFGNDFIWIWSMLQFFAVLIGFCFIIKQISLLREKNMLDALLSLDALWKSESFCVNRKSACEKYPDNMKSINREESMILGFFEDIGVFVKRKVFAKEVIWEKYSYYIDHYWDMYKSHIQAYRDETNDITWFDNFEYLKSIMDELSRQRGLSTVKKTEEEIRKFRSEE